MSLFKKHVTYEALYRGYENALKGSKKYKGAAINFSRYYLYNLQLLHKELHDGTYRPSGYTQFMVYEPKERLINAPAFRDKIVQYVVHRALIEVYGKKYIKHSYACLDKRGPHRCAQQIQRNLRACKRKYAEPWIIKADIAKYFYSIDREILKRTIRKKVSDPQLLWLVDLIIDSSPEGKTGISLGCLTSQDFATIYLNETDQYMVRFAKCAYYTRFMDDIVIVVANRRMAKYMLCLMNMQLRRSLKLGVNNKTKTFPLQQGVNACGFKIHPTHMLLRTHSKTRMKKRLRAMDRKLRVGIINIKHVYQSIHSWLGHAMHGNTYNLCRKLFRPYTYLQEVV